jgi:hypothetical protein
VNDGVPFWIAILFVLGISCSILLPVLIIISWRKTAFNPVIKFFYEILTYFRKKEYLPPQIRIEGHGIKRDLTILEAAVLLQKPVDQILGRILLDVLPKNALRIISREPIKFEVEKLLPRTLTDYERDFVRACREPLPKARIRKLVRLMIDITKTASNKIKGFSLVETNVYFEPRVAISLAQVSEADRALMKGLIGPVSEFLKLVTKETNPCPDAPLFKKGSKFMRSGSGSDGGGYGGGGGGGHSCACAGCACACAGCACACAGGGR